MEPKNLNSRAAKINFLQKLMKGEAVIGDIIKPSLNRKDVYLTTDDQIYENPITKEIIDESEFDKRSMRSQRISFE